MTRRLTVSLIALTLSFCGVTAPDAARADDIFKIAPLQRISCNRAIMSRSQQAVSCKSYAYVLNAVTSEFYRCHVSLTATRNASEVLKTESSGSCEFRTRVFPSDSTYSFDATETEPPNTNAFFGSGGSAIWVADTTKRSVRGCIGLETGVAPEIMKCVDMQFKK